MRRRLLILATVAAMISCGHVAARAQSPSAAPKKSVTTRHAKGTFEVTVKPVPLADANAGEHLGRMTLDKQFSGDLAATGKGEMLTSRSADGSGAYVAIEQVTGTLGGRKGSFVFQHTGTMGGGALQLTITVVPGSGTDELAGLTGTFKIEIVDGQHHYDFEYTLPQ